ncbi:MAG: RnfABCDGE type electron transport complex subunit D [Tissierellia bacterium]|jgi:Na+-transporting NADH:ubiquinone oxidoreductase subunit B|nr:RnfABCDGE type electron transport complex subunit D [Tissierellia bacterium]
MELKNHFMKQKMMTKVLISLIPLYIFSVWLYGLRVLFLLALVTLVGVAAEYWVMRLIQGDRAKVSEAALVTCALYTLTLPPTIPYWIAVVGIVVALILAKGAFGGFARNVFNPALVGRAFIYVSFPVQMTAAWAKPYASLPGGFIHYGVQGLTNATPMITLETSGVLTPIKDLFLGTISGSIGEGSALLILLAGVYLIYTKTASRNIILSVLLSGFAFGSLFYMAGWSEAPVQIGLLSGGFLFGAIFMATDPISAPREELSQIIYGVIIGFSAMFIRTFSLFTEGIMFAILIANSFGPLIERTVKEIKAKRAVKGGLQ